MTSKRSKQIQQKVREELHYRAFKILLQGNRFQTPIGFRDYWGIASHVAHELGLSTEQPSRRRRHQVRIVTFHDTANFDLYRAGFILRQRRYVEDGFPADTVEHTLKFRHPDLELVSSMDMASTVPNLARIKFKEAILPSTDSPDSMRRVFTHNVVVKIHRSDIVPTVGDLQGYIPAISTLELPAETPLTLVNNLTIEEVSTDLGTISFGDYSAETDMSVWRDKATGKALVAEFSWQSKFPEKLTAPVRIAERAIAEKFYQQLLRETNDWLLNGSTKTRIVYEFGGRKIHCHE